MTMSSCNLRNTLFLDLLKFFKIKKILKKFFVKPPKDKVIICWMNMFWMFKLEKILIIKIFFNWLIILLKCLRIRDFFLLKLFMIFLSNFCLICLWVLKRNFKVLRKRIYINLELILLRLYKFFKIIILFMVI